MFLISIYLFKADNRNNRTMCEICLKNDERKRGQWCISGFFIVNFERFHTLFFVSIVEFEQKNVGWVIKES